MKKLIALVGVMCVLVTSLYSPNSRAVYTIQLVQNGNLGNISSGRVEFLSVLVCVSLLPLCILDGETNVELSRESLYASGYTDGEIKKILEGQTAVTEYLQERGLKVSFGGKISALELSREFSVIPGVTQEYVNFVADNF